VSFFGILNVNKPSGITSRSVVDRVQRLAHPAKVGHAGTLDPLASGVLVVCVGRATRLIDHVQQMPKHYRGQFLLGRESRTEDIEGEVTLLADAPEPSRAQVDAAVATFIGCIEQRPPAYSAIKVAGRRSYALARRGLEVELPARKVMIHDLTVVAYEYPKLELDIHCGSGTYVRSLGRDLALRLETAAVMSALVRTAVGEFRIEDALPPEVLRTEKLADQMRPAQLAVPAAPTVALSESEVTLIANGRTIERRLETDETVAAVDSTGRLVALLRNRGLNCWGPLRNFPRDD
jgi:tRNA pseudouridine55 synthase